MSLRTRPSEVIDLDEVKSREALDFIPYVLGDMEYEKQSIDEVLKVFSFIQIKGYIETSVNMGIMNLQKYM
ncbi:hypothetical protein GCM10007362_01930 [Saccharibacillus endophyticus]|uniref:Uncharacterized protein n=1 Tax=Saccharibacillus endophyticus TaxID=2060666 RepID=A0ABQ1ZLP9_9BACL|nr:hypothetical protein GCM10007362_01930 [Saccharibacillus endophyticus]